MLFRRIFAKAKKATFILSTQSVTEVQPSIIKDFKEITKMRLALSVVFSSVAGYLLGADTIDWTVGRK